METTAKGAGKSSRSFVASSLTSYRPSFYRIKGMALFVLPFCWSRIVVIVSAPAVLVMRARTKGF